MTRPRFAAGAFAVRRVEAQAEPSHSNPESSGKAVAVIEIHYEPAGAATLILDCSPLQLVSTGMDGIEFMVQADQLGEAIDMMVAALTAAKAEAERHGFLGAPAGVA